MEPGLGTDCRHKNYIYEGQEPNDQLLKVLPALKSEPFGKNLTSSNAPQQNYWSVPLFTPILTVGGLNTTLPKIELLVKRRLNTQLGYIRQLSHGSNFSKIHQNNFFLIIH